MPRTDLSETIFAYRFILAMLMEDLEKAGVLSRKDFAVRLRGMVDGAEAEAPSHLQGANRLDFQIARLFADTIDPPRPEDRPRWTPVVHSGREDE